MEQVETKGYEWQRISNEQIQALCGLCVVIQSSAGQLVLVRHEMFQNLHTGDGGFRDVIVRPDQIKEYVE